MKTLRRLRCLTITAISTALIFLAAPTIWAEDHGEEEIPFSEAEIFFELNNSDGDLGIHSAIDGGPWKRLSIEDTRERRMLNINVRGRLRRQGLTQLFFESAEPVFDELPPAVFFNRFPEGEYEVDGVTLDGQELESVTELTHLMPAAPHATVNMAPLAVVCDEDDADYDAPSVSTPITISWPDVDHSHMTLGSPLNSEDIVIHNYEVVIETDLELADGEELTVKSSTILPPGVTSYVVPDGFIALSDVWKYEVLAREESYNQTAVESCFEIAD